MIRFPKLKNIQFHFSVTLIFFRFLKTGVEIEKNGSACPSGNYWRCLMSNPVTFGALLKAQSLFKWSAKSKSALFLTHCAGHYIMQLSYPTRAFFSSLDLQEFLQSIDEAVRRLCLEKKQVVHIFFLIAKKQIFVEPSYIFFSQLFSATLFFKQGKIAPFL
jgi:hypothetical protein